MTQRNKDDVMVNRNSILPPILSSIGEDLPACKSLEKIKMCMEYLPTFPVSEVEPELLQWTVPVIKKHLSKIYEDNFLLSETSDDDFVTDIIKQNFAIALEFVQIENMILEFLTANGEVDLKKLNKFPVCSAEIILLNFAHCKNSTEAYKTSFNVELLELFRITQTAHSLLLKLIETCILMEVSENEGEINILLEVLDIICNISEQLFDINLKSLTMNWKSYTGIIQKFADNIKDSIDLKLPIRSLRNEIFCNLKSLEDMDEIDSVQVTQTLKVVNFLLKVALKIFDGFWDKLYSLEGELLKFCSTISSFTEDYFGTKGYPPEFLNLVYNHLTQTIEPFIDRLTSSNVLLTEILRYTNISDINSYGVLCFLSTCLKCFVQSENAELDLEIVLEAIFDAGNSCFVEHFWGTYAPKNIFDDLVLNIAASVMMSPHLYPKIERILLKHVLQDNLWCSLLATEVWCLLLSNAPPMLREDTLVRLIEISEKLNFGINTYRIEYVHYANLLERVYRMLPVTLKMNLCRKYSINSNIRLWKLIGLRHCSDKREIETLCNATVESIERIGSSRFNLEDFIRMTEKMELLSTVDFNELGTVFRNLSTAVASFWELNYTNPTNNICRYFIDRLCKLTAAVIFEFNNKQLYTILNELKSLTTNEASTLPICNILRSLSERNFNDFGQDSYRISSLTSQLLYSSLIVTENPLIKQNVFEVIEKFARTGKQDIVRDVMKPSQSIQGEINDYLQRNVTLIAFPKEYYSLLGRVKFEHKCCQWGEGGTVSAKKIKLDGEQSVSAKRIFPSHQRIKSIPSNLEVPGSSSSFPREKSEEVNYDNVTEAIAGIKGEVKCLVNMLKTEKLSAKNVAELRIIVSQLSSLM